MQSTPCEMLAWMTHKLESGLLGEISTTSDMQMIPLNGWKWRETSLDEEFHLMRVKQESEKAGLKLNVKKN